MVAAAIAGSAVVGGLLSSSAQSDAADKAAGAQTSTSNASIAAQQQQFAQIQKLLNPYVQAGTGAAAVNYTGPSADALTQQINALAADPAFNQEGAGGDAVRNQIRSLQAQLPAAQAGSSGAVKGSLTAQQDLLGLNGNDAQQAAITALQGSPGFTSQLAAGNNNILQNASATGGLRGGNTQGALAQFAPALLAQTINGQYQNLAGLTSIGQNAAAGVGNAGLATANNVSTNLNQLGAAQAGNYLAQGKANAGMINSVTNGIGLYAGLGGKF